MNDPVDETMEIQEGMTYQAFRDYIEGVASTNRFMIQVFRDAIKVTFAPGSISLEKARLVRDAHLEDKLRAIDKLEFEFSMAGEDKNAVMRIGIMGMMTGDIPHLISKAKEIRGDECVPDRFYAAAHREIERIVSEINPYDIDCTDGQSIPFQNMKRQFERWTCEYFQIK